MTIRRYILGLVILVHSGIQIADSFYCLECDGVSQPRHCHTVKKCPEYYSCMVEKYMSVNGEYLYNVGCKLNMTCPVQGDNKRSLFHPEKKTCEQCCNGNLCNAVGCGQPGYPKDRGPACFSCQQRNRADLCEIIKVCDTDQVCILSTEVEFGDVTYTSHCESSQICKALQTSTMTVGKRYLPRSSTTCCSSDLCNTKTDGATVPSTPTTPTTDFGGTEFFLAFPENYGRLDTIHIYVISTQNIFHGNVTSPVIGVSKNFSTSNGQVTISSLPSSLEVSDGRSNKGVRIMTDKPVSVYAFEISGCCIGEAFNVLPEKFLGTNYIVQTTKPRFNAFLSIVGTRSRTQVSVHLKSSRSVSFQSITYHDGDIIAFMVDEMETVEILSKADLTGTTISSNHPIAVLSGNTCGLVSSSSACNQLIEYLQPTSKCGKRFILPPFQGGNSNKKFLTVVGTVHDTKLAIVGGGEYFNKTVYTIKPDTTDLRLREAYSVVATENVCVILTVVVGNKTQDPMLTQIPSVDQYTNAMMIPRPTAQNYSNYVSIMVKSSSLSNLRINGEVIPHNDLRRVTLENTEYSSFWTQLKNSSSTYFVNSVSPDDRFGLVAHGQKKDFAYGYPGGLM